MENEHEGEWLWRGTWRPLNGHLSKKAESEAEGPTKISVPLSAAARRISEWWPEKKSGRKYESREFRKAVQHPDIPDAYLVPLTRGKFAIIDAADAEALNARGKSWCIDPHGYARSNVAGSRGKKDILHRWLWKHWGLPKVPMLDHKNRDRLDCRRGNIREATPAQNTWNTGHRKNNTSGFKGVCLDKKTGRWYAQLRVGGKRINLGFWDTPEAAGAAYDRAAEKYFGEFAKPNCGSSRRITVCCPSIHGKNFCQFFGRAKQLKCFLTL